MADRYYRLVCFLVNITPKPLRELFLKYMRITSCSTVDTYLNSRKSQLNKLKQKKVIRQEQWKLLFPSTPGQSPDESSWDITLVTLLIDEFFRKQLLPVEKNAIKKIREFRNELQHTAETSIDDNTFDKMWENLELATIDIAKQIQSTPNYAKTIKEYIDDAKINNMPKLGDALRRFHEFFMMKLKSDVEDMRPEVQECRNTLMEVTVEPGYRVKRVKILDNILTRLISNFKTTMKDLPENYDSLPEVSTISAKLRDVHHVVVTGFAGSRYIDAALGAIKCMNYNENRCVELRTSRDWRRIDPELVDLVLCREPFGDSEFDEEKAKGMADIFNDMLRTANESEESKRVIIVIVAEWEKLQQMKNYREHRLLEKLVKINQPTTESERADLTEKCDNRHLEFDHATRNQLALTETMISRFKNKNRHDAKVVDEAKATLKRNKILVLTGPRKCGKTTLAITLASKCHKNQFIIINKPDDMKLIGIGNICTVLVEDFAGKYHYDKVQTQAWLKEFEMLYSAVCAGKLNVIITCDQQNLRTCEKENESHPILQNPFVLKPVKETVKQESNDESNEPRNMIIADDINTENAEMHKAQNVFDTETQNDQSKSPLLTTTGILELHTFVPPQNEAIPYGSKSFCIQPDGSILVVCVTNIKNILAFALKLVLYHISSDFEYKCYYDINMADYIPFYDPDICCTDDGDVVVTIGSNLRLFRISNGTFDLLKSTELKSYISSVSFHGNRIYCFIYKAEFLIFDTNLRVIKEIVLDKSFHFDNYEKLLPCSEHLFFSTDVKRGLILCIDTKLKQTKYLRMKDFNILQGCTATEDSVLVIGKQAGNMRILQVNSDMTVLSDTSTADAYGVDRWDFKVVFDRIKSRLFLSNEIFKLTETYGSLSLFTIDLK